MAEGKLKDLVPGSEHGEVLRAFDEYKREAEEARRTRMRINRRNREAAMAIQDISQKIPGQSTEFLPKTSQAMEQFAAFIKNALIQFDDWFKVEPRDGSAFSSFEVERLLKCFLRRMPAGLHGEVSFPVLFSDAVKAALTDSLLIFKVHGQFYTEQRFKAERGEDEVSSIEFERWRLSIDLLRSENYYPDPTGRGLYEIHEVERDLHEVVELAEQGIYDKSAVDDLVTDMHQREKTQDDRREYERGQNETIRPSVRKTVKIEELWGSILGEDGRIKHRNVVCTRANDRFLIRPPEPNPFWHGKSPFVTAPIIRVPHSVWHKALYDEASALNIALNELFNLMLDGGLASVWGVREVNVDFLDDPGQISGGLSQTMTLVRKPDAPAGVPIVEQTSTGRVPQDAMAMFGAVDREFQAAALTNDIRMGQLPGKEVRATEILEASQNQSVTLDSVAQDIELALEQLLTRAWLTIVQHIEDVDANDVVEAMGVENALRLSVMTPAERLAEFTSCGFKVHGISHSITRAREFQKLMGFMQAAGTNPLLLEPFVRRFDLDRIIDVMAKHLNLDPSEIEIQDPAQQEQRVMALLERMGPNNGRGEQTRQTPQVQDTGPQMQAEVDQLSNPTEM